MSDFIIIAREQLRQKLGLSLIKANTRDKKKLAISILVLAAVTIGVVSLLGLYIWLIYELMKILATVRLESSVVFISLIVALVGTLISGMIMLVSVLFFGKDAEPLAALPVKYTSVFIAKTFIVYLGQALVAFLLLAPIVIIYGLFAHHGLDYYVRSIVVFLCVTSLPLLFSCVAALPLMKLTSLMKNRSSITTIGGLALLVGFIYLEMKFSTSLAMMIDGGTVIGFMMGRVDLFDRIASGFPPLKYALLALTRTNGEAWRNLFYLALVTIALSVAAFVVASRLYKSGVLAQFESHKTHKAVSLTKSRGTSPGMALMLRDWRVIVRTPAFALNIFATILIAPIMMFLPLVMGSALTADPDIERLMNMLYSFTDVWAIGLVMGGIMGIFSAISQIPATAISREGKQFFWSKVIPVPYETQAFAKLKLTLISTAASSVLMCAALSLTLKLPAASIVSSIMIAFASSLPVNVAALMVDILRPKLNWANATEAIKQNMNVIIAMLIAAGLYLVVGGAAYLMIKGGFAFAVIYFMMLGLCVVLSIVSLYALPIVARRGYTRLEG